MQPLDEAPSVSKSHTACATQALPLPQVTPAPPAPHGVPGATPAEHDDIQMKSAAQVKPASWVHRTPIEES
jgi:hypothetical protein